MDIKFSGSVEAPRIVTKFMKGPKTKYTKSVGTMLFNESLYLSKHKKSAFVYGVSVNFFAMILGEKKMVLPF